MRRPTASISSSEVPGVELETCITKWPSRKSGMKLPPRNGRVAIAATVSTDSAPATSAKLPSTRSMDLRCQRLMAAIQPGSGRFWWRSSNADSAGMAVSATPNDAITARMKASASGPIKWPCTLVEKSAGRKTAMTTRVA